MQEARSDGGLHRMQLSLARISRPPTLTHTLIVTCPGSHRLAATGPPAASIGYRVKRLGFRRLGATWCGSFGLAACRARLLQGPLLLALKAVQPVEWGQHALGSGQEPGLGWAGSCSGAASKGIASPVMTGHGGAAGCRCGLPHAPSCIAQCRAQQHGSQPLHRAPYPPSAAPQQHPSQTQEPRMPVEHTATSTQPGS